MIGIYDSGLGGLTALRELHLLAPKEDIIYLGDTARVPYGTRTKETIIKYALQCGRILEKFGISSLLVACGTVSANALCEMKASFDFPITGVIEPSSAAACRASKNKKIGIIATPATIKSRAFRNEILSVLPDAMICEQACPLFVPLVESGMNSDSEMVKIACREYLEKLRVFGCDTVILGCTHYPIIKDAIAEYLPGVTLINSGSEAAKSVLPRVSNDGTGSVRYFVTDGEQSFSENASIFLGSEIGTDVTRIHING